MARYFKSYEPRHLLFSNGMQTLGVALPWAISAALVRPKTKSFLFLEMVAFLSTRIGNGSSFEIATVHIIWNGGHYNMVEFQEEMKYGRSSGVDFGPVDFVKYAESFGAKGYRATSKEDIKLGETILPDEFTKRG